MNENELEVTAATDVRYEIKFSLKGFSIFECALHSVDREINFNSPHLL